VSHRAVLAAWLLASASAACSVKVRDASDTPTGDFPCEVSTTCPAPPSACLVSMCLEEQCVYVPAPNGRLPEQAQVPGDCTQIYCDGDGGDYAQSAPFDVPRDDGNPCTEAVCDVGTAKQLDRMAGSRCEGDGVCNGHGICGVCVPGEARCEGDGPFPTSVASCGERGQWSEHAACEPSAPRCATAGAAQPPACRGIVEVAVGAQHGCLRFDDGAVACWGSGARGQLGQDGVDGASTPNWATQYPQVAFGARHACGLDPSGVVWCWGAGDFGQLGNGQLASSGAAVEAGLSARQVAVGRDHSCALTTSGRVKCWGRNDRGQSGPGPSSRSLGAVEPSPVAGAGKPPTLLHGLSAQRLALGPDHSCAMGAFGALCWGVLPFPRPHGGPVEGVKPSPEQERQTRERERGSQLEPNELPDLANVRSIAVSDDHGCALRTDGAVLCWGHGADGRLGDGGTTDRRKATRIAGLEGATAIGVGQRFGCALTGDGQVSCWGTLQGSASTALRPIAAGPAQSIHIGRDFACALGRDAQVRCWGDGGVGQLAGPAGDGSPQVLRW
jgi:alpha-tubulin suppressor-like RCC1 family protein